MEFGNQEDLYKPMVDISMQMNDSLFLGVGIPIQLEQLLPLDGQSLMTLITIHSF